MKITYQQLNSGDKECALRLESETQEESEMLYRLAHRLKSEVRCYGRVGKETTWLWVFLPVKNQRDVFYFGNDSR